nr:small acidic protein 1 [Tanacetum cinerariifolium]
MKTTMMPVEMYGEMEEQTMMTSAMEVDDVDSFDLFEQGPLAFLDHCRLADDGFFNTFSDDFDDADIN